MMCSILPRAAVVNCLVQPPAGPRPCVLLKSYPKPPLTDAVQHLSPADKATTRQQLVGTHASGPLTLWDHRQPAEQVLATTRFLDARNAHARDTRIVAVDDPHIYYLDGDYGNVISSTTLIHAFFPSFDAPAAAHSILAGKTFLQQRHRPSYKYHGCTTVDDVLAKWNEWRDLGTALHANIECFFNSVPGTHNLILPHNRKPWRYFLDLFENKHFWCWEPYRTEWAIFDDDTRIAGKIDYAAVDPKTGGLVLFDWKRSGHISDISFSGLRGAGREKGFGVCSQLENCTYMLYSLQLNLYKYIVERCYGLRVVKLYIVQLHPTLARPVLHLVPSLQGEITNMLACRKAAMS
jgi:hypothetical protein